MRLLFRTVFSLVRLELYLVFILVFHTTENRILKLYPQLAPSVCLRGSPPTEWTAACWQSLKTSAKSCFTASLATPDSTQLNSHISHRSASFHSQSSRRLGESSEFISLVLSRLNSSFVVSAKAGTRLGIFVNIAMNLCSAAYRFGNDA